MENGPRKVKPSFTIYVDEKSKRQIYAIADRCGYSRQDVLLASLITGITIIAALDQGIVKERGLAKAMALQGRKVAAALMAAGVSMILTDLVAQVGEEMDINKGLLEWQELAGTT